MHMNDLLAALLDVGGSDLHLKAGLPPAGRVRGHLTPLEGFNRIGADEMKQIIYDVLKPEQIYAFENDPNMKYELDFAYSVAGTGRFRFNVHKQRGTLGAVVRALASEIPNFDKLKLPPQVQKMTDATKGLALVTGPTGSGKSTTLAAIIDKINETRADHILTIEDPVEYVHNSKKSYVTQREVGDSADTMSFKNALKTALRQDPDVILIGEMRDYETIGIAITSAETGHLVFGTLHTQSAAQTIGRIIDVFPADQVEQVKTQLAGNIFGVLAQILLRTADGKGRACACEIMFANAAIKNNIRQNNSDAIYQTIQTSSGEGMQTMDQALMELVKSGRVNYSDCKAYIKDESTRRALASYADAPPSNGNGNGHAAPQTAPAAAQPAQPVQPQPEAQPQRKLAGLGSMIKPPWEK